MRSLPMYRRFGRLSVVLVLTIAITLVATIGWAAEWHHYSDETYQYWDLDGNHKFRWTISDGQWCHFSTYGSWSTLSTPGLTDTFIGDGSWYDMGYGLRYRYDISNDYGFFVRGALYRFFYGYTPGQWYTSGCGAGWYKIGAAGLSAGVLGDGNVYDLGNGLKFRYTATQDYGFYSRGGQYRFYYRYTPGQWYSSGYAGGWYTIGETGLCAGVLADGSIHDVGNGLKFRYTAAQDYGFYYHGGHYRFYYRYTPGQWYTSGYAGGWYLLGNVGCTAAGFFDGTPQDLGNGFAFQYDQALEYGYFLRGGAGRFSYAYDPGQWYHQGDTSAWAALTAGNYSAQFIGDGAWHGLTDGWAYAYDIGVDGGYFKLGTARRFSYSYGPSQWYHKGNTTAWCALSAADVSAEFVGDGETHDLGNGFIYSYSSTYDYGYFNIGAAERFYYTYGPEQWYHKGNTTDWIALTAENYSADFIGDGGTYNLGNGFTYQYVTGGDEGHFTDLIQAQERFYYSYGPSQWFHKGDTTDWGALSAAGVSAAFVGDGDWHDVGNGFTYQYVAPDQEGYFQVGSTDRFLYSYGLSQWYHKGDTTDWAALGTEGISAAFVGDGETHDLGNGFIYFYLSTYDHGHFNIGAGERFYYAYGPEQWYHKGNTTDWIALTAADYSAQFIGDGGTYNLGNGFLYHYVTGADEGHFFTDLIEQQERFSYHYVPSQWYHKGDTTAWGALSATGVSAEFVGDGNWHDLGYATSWSYCYVGGGTPLPLGSFKADVGDRLFYSYGPSQWLHKGDTTDWAALSATGVSAAFIGDGNWHDVGNGFSYCYSTAADYGYFSVAAAWRFFYDYEFGQWYHRGNHSNWATLTPINYSATFIGDGAEHDLGNGWNYSYLSANDYGCFNDGKAHLAYSYTPAQWYHRGLTTEWAALTAGGYSMAFIGDGAWHDLGFGNGWGYSYVSASGAGHFKAGDTERFFYSYVPSQWSHKGDTTAWGTLSAGGVSALFVGDGGTYDLGNGFTYCHVGGDSGYFRKGDSLRFSYWYVGSQWFHKGDATDLTWLTAGNYSAQFVGDGNWYDLGNGWSYSYLIASDYGQYNTGDADRFAYWYGQSQWLHKGDTTAWGALSATGISAEFVGDGNRHDVGYGFTYEYFFIGIGIEHGYFRIGDTDRFSYSYGPSQWYHKGDTTDWAALGADGISAAFVGDSETHNLGDGFIYSYLSTYDHGHFNIGAAERFYYAYGPEQWYHKGNTTDWIALTAADYSAQFIGDGGTYNLGNGLYYSYLNASDYGVLTADTNSAAGFAYSYAPGQWMHQSYMGSGGWVALTADNYSIGFIGDGQWHDLGFGNGWAYQYVGASENGFFKNDGFQRFWYNYEFACWNHKGKTTDWGGLSGSGASAAFVGDGQWHDLANGFTYQYLSAGDEAYFKVGAWYRFHYTYGPSQWFHTGNTTDWVALTGESFPTDFVGDGERYGLGNGWIYQYAAGDEGHYNDGVEDRFSYNYEQSAWYHENSHWGWVQLSGPGISAQFIGDGESYNLGLSNMWWYHYSQSISCGYWSLASDENDWVNLRFSYSYNSGLWQHKGYYGDLHHLGSEGWWDPTFLGDGNEHWVNNDDHYQYNYDYNLDHGYWTPYNTDWNDYWDYYYDVGEWWKWTNTAGWYIVHGPGASTEEENPLH